MKQETECVLLNTNNSSASMLGLEDGLPVRPVADGLEVRPTRTSADPFSSDNCRFHARRPGAKTGPMEAEERPGCRQRAIGFPAASSAVLGGKARLLVARWEQSSKEPASPPAWPRARFAQKPSSRRAD